eukprot:scaffold237098_cov33-Tisochrysis_lutea.AAC.2
MQRGHLRDLKAGILLARQQANHGTGYRVRQEQMTAHSRMNERQGPVKPCQGDQCRAPPPSEPRYQPRACSQQALEAAFDHSVCQTSSSCCGAVWAAAPKMIVGERRGAHSLRRRGAEAH